MLDDVLANDPPSITLKSGLNCEVRSLESTDKKAFHEFFRAVPAEERLFTKQFVADQAVQIQILKKVNAITSRFWESAQKICTPSPLTAAVQSAYARTVSIRRRASSASSSSKLLLIPVATRKQSA